MRFNKIKVDIIYNIYSLNLYMFHKQLNWNSKE